MAKTELKKHIRELRKEGYSLNEIREQTKLSKSTLSLWCRDIVLSKKQQVSLTKRANIKNYAGALKGALANRQKRIDSEMQAFKKADAAVDVFTKRDWYILSIGLYWAEGNKTGKTAGLVNSDYKIIQAWMRRLFDDGVKKDDFMPRLFLNIAWKKEEQEIMEWWSKKVKIPLPQFRNTIFINSVHKKKFNTDLYKGVLHLRIAKSSKFFYQLLAEIECVKKILKS